MNLNSKINIGSITTILVVLLFGNVDCTGQGFGFQLKKNLSIGETLEEFKTQHNVLIAYNPELKQVYQPETCNIQASTLHDLFKKLCFIVQLDHHSSDQKNFLVKSKRSILSETDDCFINYKIKEKETNEPITYALIYDATKKYFAYTDEQGDVSIRIPKSMHGKIMHCHTLTHHDITTIIDTSDLTKVIILYPKVFEYEEIVIKNVINQLSFNKNQGITTSQTAIEKLLLSSVSKQDVNRAIQMIAGISAIDDSKASIRIRGSNEESTLIIFDEIPIYKADHFYGIFGSFNGQYVNNVSLYKNNIPTEYGGRSSGLVKFESNNSIKPFDLNMDINLLNFNGTIHTPITNNIGIQFSGRKSYSNITNSGFFDLTQRQNLENPLISNQIISRPNFEFYDLNTKLIMNFKNHKINISGFRSSDNYIDKYENQFTIRNIQINEERFSQSSNWYNNSIGANHIYENERLSIKNTIYYTQFESDNSSQNNLVRRIGSQIVRETIQNQSENSISDKGIKTIFEFKKLNRTRLGFEAVEHQNKLFLLNQDRNTFDNGTNTKQYNFFGDTELKLNHGWSLYPGIRFTYLESNNKLNPLPQINIKKELTNSSILKLSASRQLQIIRMFDHENAIGQKQQFFVISDNDKIPLGAGSNFMLGYWRKTRHFGLDIEAYYKSLSGVLFHTTQMPGQRLPLGVVPPAFQLFSGEMRSFGTDVSLTYERGQYFSLLSYSLSKSENRFSEMFRNQWFPTAEDTRHQMKWVNHLKVHKMDLSFTYISASGRPYLDLSNIRTPLDRQKLSINEVIKNLPAYHRLDFGMQYSAWINRQKLTFGFSVFNLLDRTNVKYRQFIFPINQPNSNNALTILGSDVAQLERTYNFSFVLEIK